MRPITHCDAFDGEELPLEYRFDGGDLFYRKSSRYSRQRPLFVESPPGEMLFAAGLYEVGLLPGARYRRRNAPYLSVEYVRSGNLYVRLDGRMYELAAGDVALMHPFRVGEFATGRRFRCDKVSITVHGALLAAFLGKSGLDRVDVPEGVHHARLEGLLARFGELVDRHGREVERRNGLLCYELLQFLQSPAPARVLPGSLAELLAYMEAHLAQPLTLAELARRYGCSRNRLFQVFREHLGETPHRRLIGLRMRRARELLRSREDLSIKEITALSGYTNALNFSTEFKKHFKVSPRAYRRIEH